MASNERPESTREGVESLAEARASVALDKGETETRCVDDFGGESVTHGALEDPIATLRRYVRRAGSHGGVSAEQAQADDGAIAALDALASKLAERDRRIAELEQGNGAFLADVRDELRLKPGDGILVAVQALKNRAEAASVRAAELESGLREIAETCVQEPDTAQFAARLLDGSAAVGPFDDIARMLVGTLWLHPHYPLRYRCNVEAVLRALSVLRPEAAAALRSGDEAGDVYSRLWPTEDCADD